MSEVEQHIYLWTIIHWGSNVIWNSNSASYTEQTLLSSHQEVTFSWCNGKFVHLALNNNHSHIVIQSDYLRQLVRNDMDVNEHERLSNSILRHKLK